MPLERLLRVFSGLAGSGRIPEGRGVVQQRISGKTVEKRMAVTKVALGLKPFNSALCNMGEPRKTGHASGGRAGPRDRAGAG